MRSLFAVPAAGRSPPPKGRPMPRARRGWRMAAAGCLSLAFASAAGAAMPLGGGATIGSKGQPYGHVLTVQGSPRPRNESVGAPRLAVPSHWVVVGAQRVAFASGAGRVRLAAHGQRLARLHLVADGNSVHIATVRIVHADGTARSRRLGLDLQTGSSADIASDRTSQIRFVEIAYRARSEGNPAPATITLFGEPARSP